MDGFGLRSWVVELRLLRFGSGIESFCFGGNALPQTSVELQEVLHQDCCPMIAVSIVTIIIIISIIATSIVITIVRF